MLHTLSQQRLERIGGGELNGAAGGDLLQGDDVLEVDIGLDFAVNNIDRENSPTCQTLAAIRAAVRAGHDFSGQIVNHGNNWYTVTLFPSGRRTEVNVYFDQTGTDFDANEHMAADGPVQTWATLLSRARLQLFGIDGMANNSKDYLDAVNEASGQKLYSAGDALQTLTGWNVGWAATSALSAFQLLAALNAGKAIIACTPKNIPSAAVVREHAYVVTDVLIANNKTLVKLHDPWGYEVDVDWTALAQSFSGVVVGHP